VRFSAKLASAGEVTFAGWQTREYFNIITNNSQEEKAKRLVAEGIIELAD